MYEADGPTVQPGERRFRHLGHHGGLSSGLTAYTDNEKRKLLRLELSYHGVVVEIEKWRGEIGVNEAIQSFDVGSCLMEKHLIDRSNWLLADIFLA